MSHFWPRACSQGPNSVFNHHNLRGHLSFHLMIFSLACWDLHKPAQTCTNLQKLAQTCTDLYKNVKKLHQDAFLRLFYYKIHIKTCPTWISYIWIFVNKTTKVNLAAKHMLAVTDLKFISVLFSKTFLKVHYFPIEITRKTDQIFF